VTGLGADFNIDVVRAALIASRLAPTVDRVSSENMLFIVGASLLAMAD
jgi:hypothetical protein